MSDIRKIYLENPDDEWKSKLTEFFKEIGIPVEFTDAPGSADVTIDWPEDRQHGTHSVLHAGGKISCADSFMCTGRLKMDNPDFGNLLNLLRIKLSACQLGAFK